MPDAFRRFSARRLHVSGNPAPRHGKHVLETSAGACVGAISFVGSLALQLPPQCSCMRGKVATRKLSCLVLGGMVYGSVDFHTGEGATQNNVTLLVYLATWLASLKEP